MTETKTAAVGRSLIAEMGIEIGTPKTRADNKTYLIYGPPGVGKTRLAASASEVSDLQRVLLIDVEAGSASIENIYQDNIDVARPTDFAQLKVLLEFLINEEHEYQTVIIDTVGKLMDLVFVETSRVNTSNAFARWGDLADKTLEWIEMLHRTGMTVIVLAHTDTEKDDLTGKVTTYPYFLGRKTGKEGPKIFDIIGYLRYDEHPETKDIIRVLQTEGDLSTIAKDRTDTLPVLLGAPDFTKIYGYIKSGKPGKGKD